MVKLVEIVKLAGMVKLVEIVKVVGMVKVEMGDEVKKLLKY